MFGEGAGGSRRHVAPQQPPPDRGDVAQGVDQGGEMAVEEPGPGPGEESVVIVDDLRPGVGGRLAVTGENGVPGRQR
jgi:hypothetical protein